MPIARPEGGREEDEQTTPSASVAHAIEKRELSAVPC